MEGRRLFVVLGWLLVGWVGLAGGAGAAPPGEGPTAAAAIGGWSFQEVDTPKWFEAMSPRSLGRDSAGHLHLAYGGDHLYYAYYDGSAWQRETIDDSPAAGKGAALAVDSNNRPHIIYYDLVSNSLQYIYRDAAGWHRTTVDLYSGAIGYPGLVLDSANHPHFSYSNASKTLMYAHYNGSTWTFQPVDTGPEMGRMSSIGLGTTGLPHIAYLADVTDDLRGVRATSGSRSARKGAFVTTVVHPPGAISCLARCCVRFVIRIPRGVRVPRDSRSILC